MNKAELKERIESLSPEKRAQFERFVVFLVEEEKRKNALKGKNKSDR